METYTNFKPHFRQDGISIEGRQTTHKQNAKTRFFGPVTLTLNQWPWYTNLRRYLHTNLYICIPKMHFLGQGFQKNIQKSFSLISRNVKRQSAKLQVRGLPVVITDNVFDVQTNSHH